MQTGLQNTSALFAGQGAAPGLLGVAQPSDIQGNSSSNNFIATLQASFQALVQPGAAPTEFVAPSQMLAELKTLLDQQAAESGNLVPLAAATENLDINTLIKRLQDFLEGNASKAAQAATANPGGALPVSAGLVQGGEAGQLLAERRRLMERFSALSEAKAETDRELPPLLDKIPPIQGQGEQIDKDSSATDWMRQLYSTQMKTGQEHSSSGQAKDAAVLLAESRNILAALTATPAGDNALLSEGPDANLATAGLSLLSKSVTSTASGEARPTPLQSFIPTSLQDPQWQSDFSQRVSLIARNGNQVAEIRLNPANLGPIEVRVIMNDDQATITFSSQHGVVREAIEASLPRLREMFSTSGMHLADAQVSDQALSDQQRHDREAPADGFERFQGENSGAAQRGELETIVDISHVSSASELPGIDLFV